jgi:hypothetical protein
VPHQYTEQMQIRSYVPCARIVSKVVGMCWVQTPEHKVTRAKSIDMIGRYPVRLNLMNRQTVIRMICERG